MIELTDTNFGCHSCTSREDVKVVSVFLLGSSQKLNVRLCPKCRTQLKGLL